VVTVPCARWESTGTYEPAKGDELIFRWNSLYPIYFDAKVSIAKGRRVPREYALWWPQAQHLSIACRNLGLQSCLEVSLSEDRVSVRDSQQRVGRRAAQCTDKRGCPRGISVIGLRETIWCRPLLTISQIGFIPRISRTQAGSKSNSRKMANSLIQSSRIVCPYHSFSPFSTLAPPRDDHQADIQEHSYITN